MLFISHFLIWFCCINCCFEWIFALVDHDGVSPEDGFLRESANEISLLSQSYFGSFMRKKRDLSNISRNRCELKLVADYDFFRVIGNNNYASAARYIVNMIERVNGIFTQVDWGIDVNGYRLSNLGFLIKEIKIFERPTSISPVHFNSISSGRGDGSFSSLDVLKSFSMEEGTNATCLTVLISAKTFDYGVLGMANIGHAWERGICATVPLNGTFMNTAVITVRRKSELMITRVVDLVAAHELGHAWGSFHDDSADEECVPPNSQSGRYVMHESSNTGYDKNNYNFSPCSIKSIHKVLYEVAHDCFVEEKSALCGNGILEAGEECDGGGQLSQAKGGGDTCCTSECRLRSMAVCSPRHAECCTDTCQYAETTSLCSARNTDTCKRVAYCTGNSSKCLEPLPVKDGTDCMDEGKCLNGECIAFCQRVLPNSSPCICENVSESCQRCCRSSATGQCRPVHPVRYLSEGSICIHGQCHNNVCEKKVTDNDSLLSRFFSKLNTTPNEKFFADYFVFIIIFVSLLIWFPCGALIVYNDQRRHEQMLQKNREEEVYVVSTTKRLFN